VRHVHGAHSLLASVKHDPHESISRLTTPPLTCKPQRRRATRQWTSHLRLLQREDYSSAGARLYGEVPTGLAYALRARRARHLNARVRTSASAPARAPRLRAA
jgi:hypothetical protein